MGRLTQATDRYTAALSLFSEPPALPSWQMMYHKPLRSISKLSSNIAERASARAALNKPQLGDIDGVMKAMNSASDTYGGMVRRGNNGRPTNFSRAGRMRAPTSPLVQLNGFYATPGVLGGGMEVARDGEHWFSHTQAPGQLAGIMDDIKDAAGGLVGDVHTKLDTLDIALKVIMGLSGIAAVTGLYTAFRK
jgi:hypothetical protein